MFRGHDCLFKLDYGVPCVIFQSGFEAFQAANDLPAHALPKVPLPPGSNPKNKLEGSEIPKCTRYCWVSHAVIAAEAREVSHEAVFITMGTNESSRVTLAVEFRLAFLMVS